MTIPETTSQLSTASALGQTAVDGLSARLRGQILRPGDEGYDAARKVFNGMIDRRPALIARPADTADVQGCVTFAREHDLLVSIRGGGHSAPGYAVCDGGLMIDLSMMKRIEVNPQTRTAIAEAGLTWGEFDAATQQYGLAVTGGRVRSTGIAGLTLGGGSGWLERKLGYTVDNLIAAELVTADGGIVRVSEQENPELFWGLRGGGGNFGIVTKFEYRLHPIGPIVYGGMLLFKRDRATEILRRYRDFMEKAPDDVGGALALITAPPAPFVPEDLRGKPALGMIICFTGKPEEGEAAIRPLLELGPSVRLVQPMPYVEVQGLLDASYPPGLRNYWKADNYPELPDAAVEALVSFGAEPLSPFTGILMQPMGGAARRVAEDANAIGWRGTKWSVHVLGMWEEKAEDEKQITWVRNVVAAIKPWAQQGAYLNYLMDEGAGAVRDSFGSHYGRMVALKNKYDPTNFFRMNQNIKPNGK